jgi:CRISPR-associated endoribonuclease Cas6/Csy4 subtype I-F
MTAFCFLDIEILSLGSISGFGPSSIYQKLHDLRLFNSGRVGIDFPRWNDVDCGNIIRIIGLKDDLQGLSNAPWLQSTLEKGFIDASRIKPVPTGISRFVQLKRDRQPEKNSEKFTLKQSKRLEKRKEAGKILSESSPEAAPRRSKRPGIVFHFGLLSSSSRGDAQKGRRGFGLAVVREECSLAPTALKFSSYGLSKEGSGVPVF